MVSSDDEEEIKRLRAVALQNIESIRIARQRAERDLLLANEALARQAEELQQQREWFEVTLASIGDAVITTDTSGNVTYLNGVAEAMTGWSSSEAKGKPLERVFQIVNENTRQPVGNPIHKVLQSGLIVGLANHTALIRRSDQEVLAIEDSAAPIRNSIGEIAGAVMVFRDVTARRRAEAATEEIRRHLAAVVESSDDAIISKDLNGILISWNPGAVRMFGYRPEEAIGRSITLIIPPDHLNEEPAILERLRRGERIDHYETVRQRKDGTLIDVSLSVSPIRDGNGKVIGAAKIARDITHQKRAEAQLRDLYQAAQREIKNRERAEIALRDNDRRKDEFLATLAHELRNPLAPIRQAALISKAAAATDAQKRWSHDVINRQVHNMALLLDDLLDISRVTRGTLELRTQLTELAAIVDAAIETARPLIEAKRHRFAVHMPPEPVRLVADPLRLAQVLANLLTNAAKYTDPQGQITLRAASTADSITISVTDTGIGIPPDALEEVFAMFSQVKSAQDRSEGGLGIGLALAKGLVELHKGKLEVRSAGNGLGSEFVVRLPSHMLHVAPQDQPAASSSTQAPVKRRVLIADDNQDAAASLAMLLRLEGHEVTVVHDGREALSVIGTGQPEVVLLDIGMPEIDGYEVARRVRQQPQGRAITLIAVTGWGQMADKERALAAGFNHHFTKPIEPEKLNQLLR